MIGCVEISCGFSVDLELRRGDWSQDDSSAEIKQN